MQDSIYLLILIVVVYNYSLTLTVVPSAGTLTLQFWSPPGGTMPSISVPLLPGPMMTGAAKHKHHNSTIKHNVYV